MSTPNLSKRQRKIYDLLRTGKYSVSDITIALRYGDARSYIRDIRAKGIVIQDEWIEGEDTRFKRYWIAPTPLKPTVKHNQAVGVNVQSSFQNLFPKEYQDI